MRDTQGSRAEKKRGNEATGAEMGVTLSTSLKCPQPQKLEEART